jgi:hypothetical protein
MFDKKDNIRIFNPESILILLIVSFGLLFFNSSYNKSDVRNKNSDSAQVSIIRNSAYVYSSINFQVYKNIQLVKNNFFKLLPYSRIELSEDRKTVQQIACLQNIRDNSYNPTVWLFHYHVFPAEKEEFPDLS